MKPTFYFNRFIYLLLVIHFIIYIAWAFIELSFLKPIQETFLTTDSRCAYIMFLFVILFFSAPFYLPFKNSKNDN